MNRKFYVLFWLIALICLVFLVAADGELPEQVAKIIAGAVALVLILFGPEPMEKLFNLLRIPEGGWRVIAGYIVAGILALVAMASAGLFSGVEWTVDNVLALAGMLVTAANLAFHRLKDAGRIG